MDEKAQVSFEYLIMISVLIVIAALVMVLSENYFTMSKSLKKTGRTYQEKALEMIG